MSFIDEKLKDYTLEADPESAEYAEEFVGYLKTSAKEDIEAIKEVQSELSDGEADTDDLIQEAVLATLKWVGVY